MIRLPADRQKVNQRTKQEAKVMTKAEIEKKASFSIYREESPVKGRNDLAITLFGQRQK